MRFLLLALAFSTLVGPLAAAPVPKEILKKFPDYFPLLPGTAWEYGVGESTVTVEVQDYTERDGVRTGTLVTNANGKEVASESIRVDASGVYRTRINATKIEPPVLLLKFGIKDETEWATKCKVGEAKVDFTFKLEGQEEIETPAGKYKAVKVTGVGDIAGTKTQLAYHFAEGVGIVKLGYSVAGTETVLSLKKFTPGKVPEK